MAHGNGRRGLFISHSEVGYVALNWCLQVDFARLDQLHDGERSDGFRQRGKPEWCLRSHSSSRGICNAIAFEIHDLIVLDDSNRYTGEVDVFHLSFDVSINSSEIRTSCLWLAGKSG